MTTLAANSPVVEVVGGRNSVPIIASDIVYEGAMVGVNAAGYGRPLVAGDVFVGHAVDKVDNASGAAGDLNIELRGGRYRLEVALVGLITDVGQPVYASDDAVYTFDAVGNSYVGRISRYASATKMEVEFETEGQDEFGPSTKRETKSANYTIDIEDVGKIIYIDTDAFTITLPSIAVSGWVTFVNAGGYGTIAINLSPASIDKIMGPDIAGTDDKDLINTKATAQRGDFVTLKYGTANGWMVTAMRGIWTTEA